MRVLNGSYGEGGGQILRTALSLAAVLGEAVRMENIRAGRPQPGLRPQHLTAVKALAQLTRAEVEGAEPGSRSITFKPRGLQAGNYRFDVAEKTGSAGAVTLIAQALLPPLLKASGPSHLILRGGTHVPWSPPAHYLLLVFLPALAQMGGRISLEISRWGWYPKGGGELRLKVEPAGGLAGVEWLESPDPGAFQGLSAASALPEHVIDRQLRQLQSRLGENLPVRRLVAPGRDPGSFVFVWGPQAGFGALGARGKPAEKVAEEAVQEFLKFTRSGAALDRHLADQILLYLALARGPSTFTTEEITGHLTTNIWVIEQFLGPTFQLEGKLGEPGKVACGGEEG